ncbi:retinol dehydrogenase [Halobacillus andaensis]|uniref:Retinol dehydrogenase n=1 Tax=Halobacillus andaensis TaxID=1176239 RepID=A0A917EU67_HALAA|nr:SDR family oxidoreductase [Halobacillus andaensis]MBP2004215.1 NAD(P)-dependent dehydrogenase (short-subunit alcohol dehydrogenase family) [Halobacillus andaensis]GGF16688.1 retinol dehydrogenase [Halobacillus andaensis]
MNKKVAIITGANSGMGLAATVELASKGIHVIMACRNEARGREALAKARHASQTNHIDMMTCDLGSLFSIRQFTEEFKKNFNQLDIVMNNAGVVSLKREVTSDGFESQMGINHLGHFLLTNLLLEELKQAEDARVVNVSSGAHKWGRIHFQDPYLTKKYNVMKGYGQSKLANVLFTIALADKTKNDSIQVNAVHPGAVATNLGIDRKTGFGKAVVNRLAPYFKTPEEGAATAIYLATDPEIQHVTGQYFYDKKQTVTSKKAKDRKLAETLWIWSEREVGLQSPIV